MYKPTSAELNNINSFFFHVLLGLLATISKFVIIGFVYYAVLQFISALRKSKNRYQTDQLFIKMLLYLSSFEIISRIVSTPPWIPYEFGKYFTIVSLTFYALSRGVKNRSAFWPVLLIILSLIISIIFSDQILFSDISFNFLGLLSVALFLFVFSKNVVISVDEVINSIIHPIVIVWIYCLIRTPSFDELVLSADGASELTTGGFGTNQVATALGLGVFLMFVKYYTNSYYSGKKWIDLLILSGMSLQGLLSFSRGGMMGAGIAIIIFIIVYSNSAELSKKVNKSFTLGLILIGSFFLVDSLTDGQLIDRYAGRTSGVRAGSKEVNLNTLTTGRYDIMQGDIDLFLTSPITGVGIGNSPKLRENGSGYIAHTEISRLLAEQGLFGGIFFLSWLLIPISNLKNQTSAFGKAFVLSVLALAVFTTFHAAMRTFITPVLTGLAVLVYPHLRKKK